MAAAVGWTIGAGAWTLRARLSTPSLPRCLSPRVRHRTSQSQKLHRDRGHVLPAKKCRACLCLSVIKSGPLSGSTDGLSTPNAECLVFATVPLTGGAARQSGLRGMGLLLRLTTASLTIGF